MTSAAHSSGLGATKQPVARGGPVGSFRVLRELGTGSQGRVVLAVGEIDTRPVAIKLPSSLARPSDLVERQVQSIRRERDAHSRVRHEHVLRSFRLVSGKKRDLEYVAMVTEFAENGDLFELIADTGALAEAVAKWYFLQLMRAVQACHDKGVVHRDIKPENMLLDASFDLKLCDFGHAHVSPTGRLEGVMLHDEVGTRGYMAPEISLGKPYHAAPVDLWSAGVVLFALLTGTLPYQCATCSGGLFDCSACGNTRAFWPAPPESRRMSDAAQDLILSLLAADPDARPTVQEVLVHPWMHDAPMVDRTRVSLEMYCRRQLCLRSQRGAQPAKTANCR